MSFDAEPDVADHEERRPSLLGHRGRSLPPGPRRSISCARPEERRTCGAPLASEAANSVACSAPGLLGLQHEAAALVEVDPPRADGAVAFVARGRRARTCTRRCRRLQHPAAPRRAARKVRTGSACVARSAPPRVPPAGDEGLDAGRPRCRVPIRVGRRRTIPGSAAPVSRKTAAPPMDAPASPLI